MRRPLSLFYISSASRASFCSLLSRFSPLCFPFVAAYYPILLFDFASLFSSHRVLEFVLSFLSVYFSPQFCFDSVYLRFLSLICSFTVKILGSERQLLWQLRWFILFFSLYDCKLGSDQVGDA